MIDSDRLLQQRLRDLDPQRLDTTDPLFQASLEMLRSLLRIMAAACEAEDVDDGTATKILDRVIFGGLPSPAYYALLSERNQLQERLIESLAQKPTKINVTGMFPYKND